MFNLVTEWFLRATCFCWWQVLDEGSHQLHGRTIDPKRAKARGGREPVLKVFVGGLDPSIPESEIKDYFEQTFGKVRIILSVGWVFICLKRLKYSSIISNSFILLGSNYVDWSEARNGSSGTCTCLCRSGFPLGLGKIFQSGKITQNTGKLREFIVC